MDCGLAKDVTHILCESENVSERWQETSGGEVETEKKNMHDSTAASIHLADSFHLRRSSLTSEREKSIWRERLNGAVWQTCPLFTFWDFFQSVCAFFFFSLSAPFLKTRCTDGAKQQLLYATLHTGFWDCEMELVMKWCWGCWLAVLHLYIPYSVSL